MTVVSIGCLGRVVTGRTPSHAHPEAWGEAFPFITPSDLEYGVRSPSIERKLSDEGANAFQRIELPANSVCVTCIGATIGKMCLTSEPSFTNQQINSIVVDDAIHEPRFVYYLLLPKIDELRARAGGAATPILNKSAFSQILVNVPPLLTQRRIASILSAYDDLIENNTKRIKILEEMARALYREWFVHFRFPGHENLKFVEFPLGQIPEGWEPATLGDLVEEHRDNVKPEELDPVTPYFGLEHLPRRSITLGEWGSVGDVSSTKLRAAVGDILFGKIRPYFHKVGVCPVDAVCSSDTIILRPRDQRWASLATCVASSDDFVQHATQTSGGTKMPRANWNVLAKYPVPVPSAAVLSRFNDFMEGVVARLRIFTFQNRNLRETRDLLLPRLISGEIDVDNLDLLEAP